MDLKALYQRFRAWQLAPYAYKAPSGASHQCANCGYTYEGEYCPVCGQQCDVGRADWKSVDMDLLNFWGLLDSRSLLSFVLQMLGNWILFLIPVYYYIAYRQLFGYSIWGTIWRTLLCIGIIFYVFGIIMMLLLPRTKEFLAAYSVWTVTGMVVLLLAIGAGILVLGWWAGKRTARKENNACSYETET